MTSSPTQDCPRCHCRVRHGLPRCPSCGQRMAAQDLATHGAAESDTQPATGGTTRDGFTSYVLDELQRQILAAATAQGQPSPIFVLAAAGSGEGEVKAGEQRLFGNVAVAALIGLTSEGLVTETEDARFELTEAGKRVGDFLQNPLRRVAAEIWVPAGID